MSMHIFHWSIINKKPHNWFTIVFLALAASSLHLILATPCAWHRAECEALLKSIFQNIFEKIARATSLSYYQRLKSTNRVNTIGFSEKKIVAISTSHSQNWWFFWWSKNQLNIGGAHFSIRPPDFAKRLPLGECFAPLKPPMHISSWVSGMKTERDESKTISVNLVFSSCSDCRSYFWSCSLILRSWNRISPTDWRRKLTTNNDKCCLEW